MASRSLTDWNDLHVSAGLAEVKKQLSAVVDKPSANDGDNPPPKNADARERSLGDEPWQRLFQRTNAGNPQANISNTKLVLEHDPAFDGVLGYCNFSYRIIKRKLPPFKMAKLGEWTDADTERLRIYLSESYGFTPKPSDVLGAILVHSEEHAFHPVQDYLTSITWDGQPRVAMWLHDYLGVEDSDYAAMVGTFFLVSAVVRVMRPPVKVDSVLILEGLQGLGKSTMCHNLFGDWFTDTPMALGEKDTFQQMQGMWGIELAELDAFNKAENTKAKQFFGSQVDRYRPSYGRMVQEFPRQCVFIGTTNQDRYLKDSTGNRRYWPVMCTKICQEAIKRDRDQLWAEAVHLLNEGTPWWPTDEYKHLFEEQQEDRFDSDVWEELIYKWLIKNMRSDYSCAEIMEEALGMDAHAMRPPEQKRVGQIMHRLGFEKKKKLIKGKRPAFYFPPKGFWDAR
ncbi:virulence-associated E family protein [Pseudoalteromonas sp. ACER1]|uniref:virulence-associated E family protein n=1 Tax=unclassified Pseudoalteromonas TaxID=194690 RepID=UPI001F1593C7|nr:MULTISPECIES: virulence-associated E family protein [unclassified Pseudoalteromonas]MCF2846556.1 virulence-associated E family protein [Pseudoalteromonas sp. PAST1]MCO7210027.1 virulence-associated E family protein [Pseudoalteromonas sp. ACER1]